jgi:ABC-type phosphate/phosphonate transport system ATPase subunit
MTLVQAFSIGEKEMISLVGAGGKTTLLYALGRETIGASIRGHHDDNHEDF